MALSGNARWQRWKDRQGRFAFVVPIEMNDTLVNAMIEHGVISERDSTSKERIGGAVLRFLANAFGDMGSDAEHDALRIEPKGDDA